LLLVVRLGLRGRRGAELTEEVISSGIRRVSCLHRRSSEVHVPKVCIELVLGLVLRVLRLVETRERRLCHWLLLLLIR